MARRPRSDPDEIDVDDDESAIADDLDEDENGGDDDEFEGFEDDDEDSDDVDHEDDENENKDEDDDEDDDEGGRPIWLNPLAIVSFSLLSVVGALIGWLWFSFDDADYQDSIQLDVAVTEMPPPPRQARAPAPRATTETSETSETSETTASKSEPASEQAATAEKTAAPTGEKPQSGAAKDAVAEKPDPAPPQSDAESKSGAKPLPPPPPEEEPVALAATDPALISEGLEGPLPVIAPDGRQAWQVYARPYTPPPPKTPRIAIVIVGLGLSQTATESAIQGLPGTVTLAFAPYARELEGWIAKARAAGHEVVLELPMEPFDYPSNDPGPHTLLTTASAEENLGRLEWLLSRFTGYIGVTNTMGGKFTAAEAHMRPVLLSLKQRGLLYLDARASRKSVAGRLAAEIDMPRAINNRFLDGVASRLAIDARLLELERIALTSGAAVGIGFPYPVTLERIANWYKELHKKGIVMAPLAALSGLQAIN